MKLFKIVLLALVSLSAVMANEQTEETKGALRIQDMTPKEDRELLLNNGLLTSIFLPFCWLDYFLDKPGNPTFLCCLQVQINTIFECTIAPTSDGCTRGEFIRDFQC